MKAEQYQYAILRGKGKLPAEAYMAAYKCDLATAQSGADRLENDEVLRELIAKLQASAGADSDGILMEITAMHLDIIRDVEMPVNARIQSANALARIYSLDNSKVEVTTDKALTQLLLKGAAKS